MREYLISVIMSIYNVEPWIREAIDSIIGQDIGFEDNVQLILVNDGSTDNSGKICDEYKEKYPDNTIVVHKENGGQSSARNVGVKIASGKYLSFIDPDDILEKNAFSAVVQFYEEHGDATDVVAIPIFQFGLVEGPHPLNVKFQNGSRIIDLNKEWQMAQLSLATTFVRSEAAKAYAFEEDFHIPIAEDAKEMVKLLTRKNTLGVVQNTKYLYRKRENSSLFRINQKKSYYTDVIRDFSVWAFQYCEETFGYIPRFVMNIIMYDLQWHFLIGEIPKDLLTEVETQKYKDTITILLGKIDDDVIMAQKSLYTEQKSWILAQKHGKPPQRVKYNQDYLFGYNNQYFFNLTSIPLRLCKFEVSDGKAHISAWMPRFIHFDNDSLDIYAKVNGDKFFATAVNAGPARFSLGTPIYEKIFLYFDIPLPDKDSINIYFAREYNGFEISCRNIKLEKYFPVANQYKNSYFYSNGYLLQYRSGKLVVSRKDSFPFKYEWDFLREVWRKKRLGGRKAAILRPIVLVLRKLNRKPIWLFADKADRADDNAEALFEFCCREKCRKHRYIFLISKESPDYERIKKIGHVIPYMSMLHKFVYLLADNIISAYSHDELNNPFLGYEEHYHDLLQKCKFTFLQHGVTKDDLSVGTNKFHKNLSLFICSASRERDSILNTPAYGYNSDEVVLTGFPRFDRLYNDTKKEIVIMPTWRRKLMGNYHKENSQWDLLPDFDKSQYCEFYNSLLNNQTLKNAAEKYGYKINFVPHPVMFPHANKFSVPSYVKMSTYDVVYRDAFAHNALMITDYSSTVFDFAYLRKPVLYTHFDQNHYAEGYFDYERDGFGEVEYDLESTVDRIIEYMENGCQLKDKYRERIDNFFAFNDQNNCQRVYEKIMELETRN